MVSKPKGSRRAHGHGYSRRSVLRGTALTAAGMALAACSSKTGGRQSGGSSASQASGGTPQPGGTLNIVTQGNATTLDPHKTSTSVTFDDVGAVMSRLLRTKVGPDPNLVNDRELENDLAVKWESPDATTWTFTLRPDAKFHNVAPVNGHAVEAEDVKSSFVRALTIQGNPSHALIAMIDENQIQTPDSKTVVFKLKYPYAHFSHMMSSAAVGWILPREALAGTYDPAKQIVGSGPFLFQSYQQDIGFDFKKNPNWFEPGRPYVDAIHAPIVPDPAQRLAQFLGGNLDDIQPDPNDIPTIQKQALHAQITKGRTAGGGDDPLYLQMGDPSSPFQDIRLRRAMSLAIDRKAIGSAIYNNEYDITWFVSPGYGKWALKESDLDQSILQYYKYDPAAAKKLLSDAGATNLNIKLTYTTGASEKAGAFKAQIEAINNMLNQVGINSTLVPLDQLAYVGGGKGPRYGFYDKLTVLYPGVSVFDDVDLLLFNYFDSQNKISETRVNDPQLDAMITKARTIVDENESVKAYKDIQRYIADKVYVIDGFPQGFTYEAVLPRVQNYNYSSTHGKITETFSKVWLKA